MDSQLAPRYQSLQHVNMSGLIPFMTPFTFYLFDTSTPFHLFYEGGLFVGVNLLRKIIFFGIDVVMKNYTTLFCFVFLFAFMASSNAILDAVRAGNETKVLQLLADPHIQLAQDDLDQALILAIPQEHVSIVRHLLMANANPNAVDRNGTPALVLAVSIHEMLSDLRLYGANLLARDPVTQRTAREMAEFRRYGFCASLLAFWETQIRSPQSAQAVATPPAQNTTGRMLTLDELFAISSQADTNRYFVQRRLENGGMESSSIVQTSIRSIVLSDLETRSDNRVIVTFATAGEAMRYLGWEGSGFRVSLQDTRAIIMLNNPAERESELRRLRQHLAVNRLIPRFLDPFHMPEDAAAPPSRSAISFGGSSFSQHW